MKNGLNLLKVEMRYMPLKAWVNLIVLAVISGAAMGLVTPLLLENVTEESLHIFVGFMIFGYCFLFPSMIIRGDAYRVKDPHAKITVPDIYILLQLMPLTLKEKAWNRLLSMMLYLLIFNGFSYIVACVTMIIAGTLSTVGVHMLIYLAIGWLFLSGISGLAWVISEPESRKYRHRDLFVFLLALIPFLAVFAVIGWLTDLWFFALFIEGIVSIPIITLLSLAVVFIVGVIVSIKSLQYSFKKVDYYV